jgi:hypothetical protein
MTAAAAGEAAIEVADHRQKIVGFDTIGASGFSPPILARDLCVLVVRHYELSPH